MLKERGEKVGVDGILSETLVVILAYPKALYFGAPGILQPLVNFNLRTRIISYLFDQKETNDYHELANKLQFLNSRRCSSTVRGIH